MLQLNDAVTGDDKSNVSQLMTRTAIESFNYVRDTLSVLDT